MILTFYSYKGGVGRSMAMANVADILARHGLRVLTVDFDLEAPGLEQFFQINQPGARRHPGLLDLLLSYKQSMSVAGGEGGGGEPAFRRPQNFIFPVYERLPGGGRLDLMPAGQREDAAQLERYALSLRTFDWQDFYYHWEGELFFEWLRRSLVPEPYDVALVDSRTGVTEMGGICAYQLADVIVMLCAANHQNVQGTLNMVRDFDSPSVRTLRRSRPLAVIVVPARVEQRDDALLQAFAGRFDQAFSPYLPEPFRRAGLSFLELMIPYEPAFAFEERVLTDPVRTEERKEIGVAFHKLADAVALLAPPETKLFKLALHRPAIVKDRRAITLSPKDVEMTSSVEDVSISIGVDHAEAQYDVAKRFAGYDVFIDYGREDRALALALAERLKREGLRVFMDVSDLAPGQDFRAALEEALFHSRVLLFCLGAGGLGQWRQQVLRTALEAEAGGGELRIVPVLLPGAEWEHLAQTPLGRHQALDLRGGLDEAAFARLRELVVAGAAREAPQAAVDTGPPFVGARAFDEQHADIFFGRERTVRDLLSRLQEGFFVAVTGPSGCGKTSLIRAGLLPALRRGASSGERWSIAALRPGNRPLESLAAVLVPLLPQRSADDVARVLAQDEEGLSRLLVEALSIQGRNGGGDLLVFVDQFEEVFTQCADADMRERFVANLTHSARGGGSRVYILVVIRADFFSRCTALPGLAPLLQSGLFIVPAMTPEELRQVIERPAERVGLAFEPGLVDRMVKDVEDEPGILPLLQFLLRELWERRRSGWLTNAAYDEIGGVRGALASRAEQVYGRLSPAEQAATRWVLLRLIRPGQGTEDTRQRVGMEHLLPAQAREDPERAIPFDAAIKRLIEAGLLIAGEEGGRQVIEPAHESLIRGWQRLRGWLQEDRAFLLWRERLQAALRVWLESRRDEGALLRGAVLAEAENVLRQHGAELSADEQAFIAGSIAQREREAREREKSRRRVIWALVSIVVVLTGLTWFALEQRSVAEAQRQLALSQLETAEADLRAARDAVNALSARLADLQSPADRQAAEAAYEDVKSSLDRLQYQVDESKAQWIQRAPPKQ